MISIFACVSIRRRTPCVSVELSCAAKLSLPTDNCVVVDAAVMGLGAPLITNPLPVHHSYDHARKRTRRIIGTNAALRSRPRLSRSSLPALPAKDD